MIRDEYYDWETREDASTLERFSRITSDPARLQKAQDCILAGLESKLAAVGIKSNKELSGKRNSATIKKLDVKY